MLLVTGILRDLFLIFLAAKIAAELFERLGQPAVVGELIAGAIIGPHALALVGIPDANLLAAFSNDPAAAEEALTVAYQLIAELGVVVLLFYVGLETRFSDILAVGGTALVVAIVGVVTPFVLGYLWISGDGGGPPVEGLFVGAAMVATSVGITARVIRDLRATTEPASRIILGAAVIDDILGMIVLAVVAGLASTGSVRIIEVVGIVLQAVLFTIFVILVGSGAIRRFSLHLNRLRIEDSPFIVSLLVMLGLAALSAHIGLAAIIGAFLAGMVFAEAREQFEFERRTEPIYQFLVPFFFVITGAEVDWRLFLDPQLMTSALVVTLLAIVGKLVTAFVVRGRPLRERLRVGVGMVPRGEVGLIVASLGLSLHAIPLALFNVVVVMSITTTLIVPPILRVLFGPTQPPAPPRPAEPALARG